MANSESTMSTRTYVIVRMRPTLIGDPPDDDAAAGVEERIGGHDECRSTAGHAEHRLRDGGCFGDHHEPDGRADEHHGEHDVKNRRGEHLKRGHVPARSGGAAAAAVPAGGRIVVRAVENEK